MDIEKKINAIILAAGRGSRMKDLTDQQPKCLVKIAGKSLLDWQISALKDSGIHNITIVRGYKADRIKGNFKTLENNRWAETNMVKTLMCASSLLQKVECVVAYSDILYHPDHIRQIRKTQGDICITYDTQWNTLWKLRFKNPLSDAETFKQQNGLLLEIGNRANHIDEISGQYMGLIKITPAGWEQITSLMEDMPTAQIDKLDMTALLKELLKKKIQINVVPVSGKWCEVDSETDLICYEKELKSNGEKGKSWEHDWRY